MDALGDANPLFSATGDDDRVTIFRHPDMHGVFDDVFTLDWPDGVTAGNNMGPGLFISTAALMAAEIPSPTDAHNSPHGTPWGGPSADLTVVTSGGEACTP